MNTRNSIAILSLNLFLLISAELYADVKLPSIFSDDMILQRDAKIPIWGWADPGEKVTVRLGPHQRATVAGDDGKWRLDLPPVEVKQLGGSYELTVTGKNTIQLKNVLVGEVWICAGQSNMEMPLGTIGTAWQEGVDNSELEVSGARYPEIRLFTVWKHTPVNIDENCQGKWTECNPETAYSFPAPGYFFGRRLHKELNIPIGLIHNAYAGVAVDAYIRSSVLENIDGYSPSHPQYENHVKEWPQQHETYQRKVADWHRQLANDAERGGDLAWAELDYVDASWEIVNVPPLEASKPTTMRGNLWFRKEIDIPIYWGGRDVAVHLPAVKSMDIIYFNGTPIAKASSTAKENVYRVPATVVKPWRNVIALRISNASENHPLDGNADEMKVLLPVGPDADPISLAGQWRCTKGLELNAIPARPAPAPDYYPPPDSTVYNGMVAPLIPFAIKGVIFYQGESNVDRGEQYGELFSAMIRDWRQQWGQGDFPFYFVQITNWAHPVTDAAAELRDSQLSALSLPNTGMAVAIDTSGIPKGHPSNKLDIGERLALWALAKSYGRRIVPSGPLYKSMSIEGDRIRLSFDYVGSGLLVNGESLSGFEIAGKDQKLVEAMAVIDGDTVLVSSDKVQQPVAVRYAWENVVLDPSLYNKDGLPASPFRTDDWPGSTSGKTKPGWWR